MLTEQQIVAAAHLLTETREARGLIEGLGELTPPDVATAERIADVHAEQLGLGVAGWKVGATSELAQQIMRCSAPFCGRILDGTVHHEGELSNLPGNPEVECEFAFVLGADIAPGDRVWSAEDARAATEAVAPAIEIIGTRFTDFRGVGYLSLIADSAANGGVVLGGLTPTADIPDLASIGVKCEIDGKVTGQGFGSDVLGDPWNALTWLLNHLSGRGIPLRAGDIVMSGTCSGVSPLPVGSTVVVDYGEFGQVTCFRS